MKEMKLGNFISKVVSANAESFIVHLKFADETTGAVDLSRIFDHSKGLSAEILRGGMFDQCYVENGALAWPNGFELCPDTVKQWMVETRLSKKTAVSPHR